MSKKADPSSRRSPRRRPLADAAADPHVRPSPKGTLEPSDSDFGLCLALAPALRRRGES
jgi:hypothetical protein